METLTNEKSGRQRRKVVKKMQRKRSRQKAAKERDKKLEEVEAANLRNPAYQVQQQNLADLEEYQREADERQRQYEEEAWLRRELLVQRHFRAEQQRRAGEESKKQAALAAFEAKERQEREQKQKRAAEIATEFESTMQRMQEYLTHEEDDATTAPPELCRFVDSRPGAKQCEFYARTNCCRFGAPCLFNHRRPLLSRIIVVRHFFTHALLQPAVHEEYAGADAALEMNEHDLRDDYDVFFEDVVPEMERYGALINFRTIRNVHPHLRGHVFVEYATERAALKAFIALQGRYYATRRLNVEFSNLVMWRGAICGLSVTRKCPKAQNCNYLHLFSNPKNKYNTLLEYTQTPTHSARKVMPTSSAIATPLLSWDDVGKPNEIEKSCNWRWSQSPEPVDKSVKTTNAASTSKHSCSPVQQRRSESSNSTRAHKNAKDSHKSHSNKHSTRSRSRESNSKGSRHKSRTKSRSRSRSSERRSSRKRSK